MHNFSRLGQAKNLWQQISSHWSHRDRPTGQRFLGSVRLSQKATNDVLDIVGDNLRTLKQLTYDSLYEKFGDLEQNWLKILTFALSEYAYYYSSIGEGFWHGFCERLKLRYTHSKENTLRQVVGEGFDLLGIVKAKGGYRYVSTLWLQSGIPQQNLTHFSQLVQEVSDEYGWWELSHTSYDDLSQELLEFCQEKHPQWGTLINFLKSSCSERDQVEAISGSLVQGIAVVAQAIERQGASAEVLKNEQEREKLLGNYYLPQSFFLRNWETLIQVLTPKERYQRNSKKIGNRRPKPLSLVLDIFDSLNIQLILPEQSLWKSEWQCKGGTFCKIADARWEGNISTSGEVTICTEPVNVKSVAEQWTWQLLDHLGNCLNEWKLEGIATDFPCLIFDAWTGDNLNLDFDRPIIKGTKEIICYTPTDVCLDFGDGIEILDSCVPCSIKGWQGQQLKLTTTKSSIVFIVFSDEEITTFRSISWKLSSEAQPSLRGIQLKGKKSVYIEIPTFWYPPVEEELSLNISIENITRQRTIVTTNEKISPSINWQEIPLAQWVTEPGKYETHFWNQSHRWSYEFEIELDYHVEEKLDSNELKISSALQGRIKSLPIKSDNPDKFWAQEIHIEALWPLEVLTFKLSERQEKVFYLGQADTSGNLRMSLATFYDLLPGSDWYALDYQRFSVEPQRLIEMDASQALISWNWANKAIHISGLSFDQLYSLSCWNLLLPQNPPVKIKITLISPDEQATTVPLELPPGIYHIQLDSSQKKFQNLGWWCGSNQYDLPDEALDDEALENYCYTILGNESVQDFLNAAEKFDYDCRWIETVVESMNLPYHLPEWLSPDSFLQKLQTLIQSLSKSVEDVLDSKKTTNSEVFNNKILHNNNRQKWLLLKLSKNKKPKLVVRLIQDIITRNNLQDQILNIETPKEWAYKDSLLLEVNDYEVVKRFITIQSLHGYVQEIISISNRV
jgi:hypothetical protein